MSVIVTFLIAFVFSFLGSIPPATINLTVIQLGLEGKRNTGLRLAFAAALIEYPYAWIAIKFKSLFLTYPVIEENLHLITAIVMITLGIINLRSTFSPTNFSIRFNESGFRRGLLLGLLNPLAIPYWLGITAYLETNQWTQLSSNLHLHSYLLGISAGALLLLTILLYLSNRIILMLRHADRIKKIPGVILLSLGVYALIRYLF